MVRKSVSDTVQRYFVTPAWVEQHYGVTRHEVYRAIGSGKLQAVEVRSGRRRAWVLDVRDLPPEFPS